MDTFTDKYGRTVQYHDNGFGWATLHVLGAMAPDDGLRAFTLDWRGNAPGSAAAVQYAEVHKPGWWVEPPPPEPPPEG